MSQPEPRSAAQRLKDAEEQNAQGAAASTASQVAAEQHSRRRQTQLIQELSEADVLDAESGLKDILGVDFGRTHILAQKEEEDVWRNRWLNENEADRIIHEHNPGRLCKGPFLELAQRVNDRDADPKKPMTAEGKRQVRTALEAKTEQQTMSKGGKTFRGITEIVTTSKVERNDNDDGDRGRLGKVRDKLFG